VEIKSAKAPSDTQPERATPEQLHGQLTKTEAEIGTTKNSRKETEQNLREVRAQMGLPEFQDSPHSMQQSESRLKTLEERRISLSEGLGISENQIGGEE